RTTVPDHGLCPRSFAAVGRCAAGKRAVVRSGGVRGGAGRHGADIDRAGAPIVARTACRAGRRCQGGKGLMEIIVAIAIGILAGSGIWLLLRPRTFQVIIGLSLLSYAVNLF